jgi:Nucleotidyl transferase AbiEii toxin, Type IV TA system
MVLLGLANSRMKDFYDVWVLSRNYSFDQDRLTRAVVATFERRGTTIPVSAPVALTQDFANDAGKQQQWAAFTRDLTADIPSLEQVVTDLAIFLMPYAHDAKQYTNAKTAGV